MAPSASSLAGYVSGNRRLYAQLRPDAGSLEHLLTLQESLAARPEVNDGGRPRWISERQLHLTLIHFGKVRDVYAVVSAASDISWNEYEGLLAGYVAETEAAMPLQSIRLEPAVMSRFGRHGLTLVVEYFPSSVLLQSHARAYAALEGFLHSCGIEDTNAFTAADPNFMFASRLRPHITLARGFAGTLPAPQRSAGSGRRELAGIRVESMPVVYSDAG